MKTFTAEWEALLETGGGVVHGAVLFDLATPFAIWGGYGELTIDGVVHVGTGGRGMVTATGGSLGSAENEIELILAGTETDQLNLIQTAGIRDCPVIIRRLGCSPSGAEVLDETIYARGRVAQVNREETGGGEAAIKVGVEGASSGLGRNGGRMTTDTDQALIDATDTALRRIGNAATKTIYWGGQPPAGPGHVFPSTNSALASAARQVLK